MGSFGMLNSPINYEGTMTGYDITRLWSNVGKMIVAGTTALIAVSDEHAMSQKLEFIGYALVGYTFFKAIDVATSLVEDCNRSKKNQSLDKIILSP